jgi:HEAT repeat protein
MQEDLAPWYGQFWSNSLYRLLLVFIAVEILVVLFQLGWIFRQSSKNRKREMELKRAVEVLQPLFMKAMMDSGESEPFVARAWGFKAQTLMDFILPYLGATSGDYLERVKGYYKRLDLLNRDIKDLKSPLWHKRLIALRHVVSAGGDEVLAPVLAMKKERHIIRTLAAVVVAKFGTPEQLMEIVISLEPSKRIMEQPLVNLLKGLSPGKIDFLMSHFDGFVSPTIRRLVLSAYAQVVPEKAAAILPELSGDPSKEVRIGVCGAAGDLAAGEPERWLLGMLHDPEWEVRAQAAKALGRYRNPVVIPELETAICDKSFWVRQNAAASMSMLGPAGLIALRDLAAGAADRFAADAAIQEIRRHELFVQARS